MKKSFIFLATAFLLNASVAKSYPPPPLLDDSASFRIAKSVKLGYGDSSRSPSKGTGTKTSDFKTCSSDNNCPSTQKCVDGNCKDVCSPNPCPEETPDCEAKDHSYTCKCTETSCGTGKKCVDGECLPCEEGTKCNCTGEKVIDSSGKCVCPKKLSCSAGQYVSGDCSCKNCQKDDTSGDKCGCPGNTVPDGNGSCYCKETKTCNPGYTFDDSNTCECVVCTGSDCNCPAGTVPTADGCKEYACAVDEDCAEGNRCENGKTENAQCVPCGKNEQCRCPEGQLSDGTGKCVPVACKAGLVCSNDITEQCCDAGMQCVNPDTVESYCAACEVDTQCTCPDGYLVNNEGNCVKPECKTNSDCPNGKYCENPGKSNAECIPCNEGEPCPTCPTGYVADGNGGCKLGCTFDTASVCVSGTTNCKTCTQSGGCYTCTDCKDGYYPDNGTCVSCKQKFGDNCEKCTPNKCTTCAQWYEPDPYTGKCKAKACPDGYSTSVTSCDSGYTLKTNGYSGGNACGYCEPNACPSGYSTSVTSCDSGYTLKTNGYSGANACGYCEAKACPDGYSTSVTSCDSGYTLKTNGYSGDKACGYCEAANCPNGYSTSVTSCGNGYTLKTNGYSGGKACGSCEPNACPSGYSTSVTSCGNGYTLKTSGYSAGKACGYCEPNACPSGYSTSVTSCDSGYTLKTNGYSGGNACGKCEIAKCPDGYSTNVTSCSGGKLEINGYSGSNACGYCKRQTCAEMGGSTSCGQGYEPKTIGSSGWTGVYTWEASDGTCYDCIKRECPAGYSTSVTYSSCSSKNQIFGSNGYSGSEACGRCESNSCSSKGGHRACDEGYECAGDGCRVCKAGSNLSTGYDNCNCPVNTWSTGYGGCSSNCPSGYKKEYDYYRKQYYCSNLR